MRAFFETDPACVIRADVRERQMTAPPSDQMKVDFRGMTPMANSAAGAPCSGQLLVGPLDIGAIPQKILGALSRWTGGQAPSHEEWTHNFARDSARKGGWRSHPPAGCGRSPR